MSWLWDDERPQKRSLGTRDKQILLNRAGHRCENCGEAIDYESMVVGHKNAWSKGGSATLRNSVALCYKCNKLQGTDSWTTFQRKQGKTTESLPAILRKELDKLTLTELKFLAKKYAVRVKGRTEETFFGTERKPPSKGQYVTALARALKMEDIEKLRQ